MSSGAPEEEGLQSNTGKTPEAPGEGCGQGEAGRGASIEGGASKSAKR
jgi:hypothetical protein